MVNPTSIDANHRQFNISLTSAQARQKVTSTVATSILEAFSFDEDATFMMDYACGSGTLSQKLAPYSKRIIGVDIDPNAVRQYNTNVANQGISLDEMQAICVDLLQNPGELSEKQFDVIVCSQAYHHFPSIEETTQLLVRYLKPRGMLFVSDLVKGDHAHEFRRASLSTQSHDHGNNVVHQGGLTEPEVRASFEDAGLIDIEFEIIETVIRQGREIQIFLSRGMRSADEN